MDFGAIINGHINEVLGKNTDIALDRLSICYSCPLYSPKLGGTCNSKLWLNPNTGDVSTVQKDGYKQGCGCRLEAKTRVLESSCPLGKW